MSPALAEIKQLSDELIALSAQQDWPAMLKTARQRQQQLEAYFGQQSLPDEPEAVRETLTAIQQADRLLANDARNHRQQMLQDAVDLRQRWQMSNAYHRIDNLPT